MRIKTRYTETQLALMPLEVRIDAQIEIVAAHGNDIQTKRKNRNAAIKNPLQQFNLDTVKMESRLALAEKAIAARNAQALVASTVHRNTNIYCSKTGAFIATLDTSALAFIDALEMPFDETEALKSDALNQWQSHHAIHPAWMNTSPSVLAQLQRLMPHEYVVYLYTYLMEHNSETCQSTIRTMAEVDENKWHEVRTTCITTIPAPYKHHLLRQLYVAPLADVIEIAELLRILAALMGKSKPIINAMPQMAIGETLFVGKFRSELLAFLRQALATRQKKHHSRDSGRAKLITSADLYEIVSANGIKLFGAAKINPDDDNPVIGDVADLFATAGLSSLIVAKHYSKVKAKQPDKKKRPEFSAKLIPSMPTETIPETGIIKLKPITL